MASDVEVLEEMLADANRRADRAEGEREYFAASDQNDAEAAEAAHQESKRDTWRSRASALSVALSAMERVEVLEKSASQNDRELMDAAAKTWRRYQALEAALPLMKEALESGHLALVTQVQTEPFRQRRTRALAAIEAALDAARKVTT
jgi:hypothetical protein